jgi:hypothetical protein
VTKEKKAGLERMMAMERTVRDLLGKQEDGEEALVKLIQQGNEEFTELVARGRREQTEREGRLREQLQEALAKIRGYTRDMEEQLDRERLGLEEVGGGSPDFALLAWIVREYLDIYECFFNTRALHLNFVYVAGLFSVVRVLIFNVTLHYVPRA